LDLLIDFRMQKPFRRLRFRPQISVEISHVFNCEND